jgi:predicted permease
MIEIITAITPLFFVIFLGVLLERYFHLYEKWEKPFNDFTFYIGFPSLLFSSLTTTSFYLSEQWKFVVINSAFILIGFFVILLIGNILRLSSKTKRTLIISILFGNVAYLGMPILTQILGNEILPTLGLIIATYIFWIFTLGVGYLELSLHKNTKTITKDILRSIFTNPLLLATLLGVLCSSFSLTIPSLLQESVSLLSESVTPLVLLIIGLFIGHSRIGNIREWIPVFGLSLFTLFFLPGIFLGFLLIFGLSPQTFFLSLMESAMPLAITAFALADKYQLHKKLIARTIVLSTLLSAFSLVFWTTLLLS